MLYHYWRYSNPKIIKLHLNYSFDNKYIKLGIIHNESNIANKINIYIFWMPNDFWDPWHGLCSSIGDKWRQVRLPSVLRDCTCAPHVLPSAPHHGPFSQSRSSLEESALGHCCGQVVGFDQNMLWQGAALKSTWHVPAIPPMPGFSAPLNPPLHSMLACAQQLQLWDGQAV